MLLQAAELLERQQKPPLQRVKALCERVEELDLADGGFQAVDTLQDMLSEYEAWVAESIKELEKNTPEEARVRERIRQIKHAKLGLRRQEALYRLFKEYLQHKPTSE